MKQIDLDPSEWISQKPKRISVWKQMREASRNYQPPPITLKSYLLNFLAMSAVMTALYLSRHWSELF